MKASLEITERGMELRAANRQAWDGLVSALGLHARSLAVSLAHVDPSLLARQQGYCAALLDLHDVLREVEKSHAKHQELMEKRR